MAKVVLYGFIVSPPTRACMLVCEALGVEYSLKLIDVATMEHRKPEYLKLNPVHSIPTMVDGDYVLFDSHAISCYIANKYGKDHSWYPTDPQQRGTVDQRLHFNCSVLLPPFKDLAVPLLFGKKIDPSKIAAVENAVTYLDKLLGEKKFIALDHPTIADCSCASTVLGIQCLLPDAVPQRVADWLLRCKTALPGFDKVGNPAVEQMEALGKIDKANL